MHARKYLGYLEEKAEGDLGRHSIEIRFGKPLTAEEVDKVAKALGHPKYVVTEEGKVQPLTLPGDFEKILKKAHDLRAKWDH